MPHNFSFIVQGKLAGMERPGSYGKLRDDLEFLKMNGVHAIVSLTETPLEKAFVEEFGFKYLHLPIPDFTPPSGEQIEKFLSFYMRMESEGHGTLVHCGAGLGRTGTMLACALVERGMGRNRRSTRCGRNGRTRSRRRSRKRRSARLRLFSPTEKAG